MKTKPLSEVVEAANLGELFADEAHSIVARRTDGKPTEASDLVATVFDVNIGHERAVPVSALLAHSPAALLKCVEALERIAGQPFVGGCSPQSAARGVCELQDIARAAITFANSVPVP